MEYESMYPALFIDSRSCKRICLDAVSRLELSIFSLISETNCARQNGNPSFDRLSVPREILSIELQDTINIAQLALIVFLSLVM